MLILDLAECAVRGGEDGTIVSLGEEPIGYGIDDGNEELQRKTASLALSLASYGLDMASAEKGPGFLAGPRRYFQHSKIIHVYWEYLGWMKAHRGDDDPASYTVFYRVVKKVFKDHLGFRKKGGSQHAECDQCCEYKRELQKECNFKRREAIIERCDIYEEHAADGVGL